ncbi:peroxide stress protein YaaA [Gemmobacter caeruleus]|uniref:peroxide stress protein YaaA n=1 Tax=Gemmobacter caeruleus TaxID=2595004 RepID=UPI0011EEB3CA|nr:peroxide stress protein YaaA [Gemmobacter caeruleus]
MLTVISPAKRLADPPAALPPGIAATEPDFPAETLALASVARGLSEADLGRLMDLSPALAQLNHRRFAAFGTQDRHPAALLFDGDTYAGLEAPRLEADAWRWSGLSLRILSGLYGLLRPTDLIEPYRLEMGTRLVNPRGADLYAWWGTRIATALNAAADGAGARFLLNCASIEYFRAVDRGALRLPVVTPVFLEDRPGGPKVISFHAKKARGALARHVMIHRLTDPADLRGFTAGGYRFDAAQSQPETLVFRRADQAAELVS